jgi:hypothetical protein
MKINIPVNDRKSGTQYAKKESIKLAKNIDCSRGRFKCISCLYLDSDYSSLFLRLKKVSLNSTISK